MSRGTKAEGSYFDWLAIAHRLQGTQDQVTQLNNELLKKLFAVQEPVDDDTFFALSHELQSEHGINWLIEVTRKKPLHPLKLSELIADYRVMPSEKTKLDHAHKTLHWGQVLLGVRPLLITQKYAGTNYLGFNALMQTKVIPHEGVDYFSCYQSFGHEVQKAGRTAVEVTTYFVPTFMIDQDVPLDRELSE